MVSVVLLGYHAVFSHHFVQCLLDWRSERVE